MSEYVYGRTEFEDERRRLDGLETQNDPRTRRILTDVGVGPGWHCLEVGGGGGSVAAWLADRVGPTGRVVATDLDTRFLDALEHPSLEVRRHDILADPLEPASFDLVHSRFLLEHLPEDRRAVQAMLEALKPGGVLVAEDVDFLDSDRPETVLAPAEAVKDVQAAWEQLRAFTTSRGIRGDYGRRLPLLLAEHGLVEIGAIGERRVLFGGTAESELPLRSIRTLGRGAIEAGYGDAETIERAAAWMSHPEYVQLAPLVIAAWGRKPG